MGHIMIVGEYGDRDFITRGDEIVELHAGGIETPVVFQDDPSQETDPGIISLRSTLDIIEGRHSDLETPPVVPKAGRAARALEHLRGWL
ncbi:MAG: hypothetical protein ACXWLH_04595 [Candidatus Saccharimonadales bacterium]